MKGGKDGGIKEGRNVERKERGKEGKKEGGRRDEKEGEQRRKEGSHYDQRGQVPCWQGVAMSESPGAKSIFFPGYLPQEVPPLFC